MKNFKKAIVLFLPLCLLLSCLSLFASADSTIGNISTEQMIIPPTAEQAAAAVSAARYSIAPGHIIPFVYDGTDSIIWADFDVTGCEEGYLYTYNTNTNTLAQIADSNVICYTATLDDLYYATSDFVIYQTDFTGSLHLALYSSAQGAISHLNYYNGFLTFIEAGTDVKVLDINSGSSETVFSNNDIDSVYFFDNDKFVWRNSAGDPVYYNITSKSSVSFDNEHEVNCVVAPYITPIMSEDGQAELMSTATNYNDITMPFPDYPAVLALYNDYNGYPNASSFYLDEYAGTHQCDAFANYVFDRYHHVSNSSDEPSFDDEDMQLYSGQQHNPSECTGVLSQKNEPNGLERIIRIANSVDRGAFIRFGKVDDDDGLCKQQHSGVIASVDSNGFWLYESNNDNQCGVFYTYYTFDDIICKYHCVRYYVDHAYNSSATYHSSTRHKRSCSNCDGYLLPRHTASAKYTTVSLSFHKLSFACCSGHATLAHTGIKRHLAYDDTYHYIDFTCCPRGIGEAPAIKEKHVYSGNYPECLKCAYSPELGYSLSEEEVE